MVLRGAFWHHWIGFAISIPSAIEAGNLMMKQLFGMKPCGTGDVDLRYPAALLRGLAGFDDSGIAQQQA
jgi:hypothetical protein